MRRVNFAPLLLSVVLLTACATGAAHDAKYASGVALQELGKQFLAAGQLYDQAILADAITEEEYQVWVDFIPKFQGAYRQAYMAWLAGTEGTDEQISALRIQLEIIALKLVKDKR